MCDKKQFTNPLIFCKITLMLEGTESNKKVVGIDSISKEKREEIIAKEILEKRLKKGKSVVGDGEVVDLQAHQQEQDIKKKLEGLTDEEKNALLSTLMNT